jgi:ketosteroid isomerase-like protein
VKRFILPLLALLTMTLAVSTSPSANARAADQTARQSLEAFNQTLATACDKMDQQTTASLWADDGVDLIQGMQPMIGKKVIADWLEGLPAQLQGAKMLYCKVDWRDVKIEGNFAYEWAITRQKIELPAPHDPIESEGKMLLILKRRPDGTWKQEVESWNSNPQPEK